MPLMRDAIMRLLPHAGDMVLLDQVVHWDERSVLCRSGAHLRPDNPLRRDGRLPAVAGIEIAAQAMAVHGGLVGTGQARMGLLGSLREVALHTDSLDRFVEPLDVIAEILTGGGKATIYSFRLLSGDALLVAGRAGVFFP